MCVDCLCDCIYCDWKCICDISDYFGEKFIRGIELFDFVFGCYWFDGGGVGDVNIIDRWD